MGNIEVKSCHKSRSKISILGGALFMIKVLFICHGGILKSPEKVCKINGFMTKMGTYHTTTTPFLKEP